MVHIQVQAPYQATVNQVLEPPVVAIICANSVPKAPNTAFAFVFASLHLFDSSGYLCDGELEGPLCAAAVLAGDSRASSSSSNAFSDPSASFTWSDIRIVTPGIYRLRIDVYSLDPVSLVCATVVEQITTHEIEIYIEREPTESPCPTPSLLPGDSPLTMLS